MNPKESNKGAFIQPTLWVILGGWGLLSAGKLPVASLPGSFHGWDPSESYREGEGRSRNIWTQAEQGRGLEGGFQMGLQGPCIWESSLVQSLRPSPLLVPELPGDLAWVPALLWGSLSYDHFPLSRLKSTDSAARIASFGQLISAY